jgi:hypothetical protein
MLTPSCRRVDLAWFQRLKLKYDEPPSKFAFNFKLRSYTQERQHAELHPRPQGGILQGPRALRAAPLRRAGQHHLAPLPRLRQPGRGVIQNKHSTDVLSTINQNFERARINAHILVRGSVGHHGPGPRICPECKSCSLSIECLLSLTLLPGGPAGGVASRLLCPAAP